MKKRTKQEKMRAEQRRQEKTAVSATTYQHVSAMRENQVAPQRRLTSSDLFKYDIRLIQKDLIRTVSVTVIVVSVLFGIFFYLK